MKLPTINSNNKWNIITYQNFKKKFSELNNYYAATDSVMKTMVQYKYMFIDTVDVSGCQNHSDELSIVIDLLEMITGISSEDKPKFFDKSRPIVIHKSKTKKTVDIYWPFK